MEWSDEKVLLLIEEYKSRPGLWDPSHPDYKLLNKKSDNWKSLADAVEKDVGEVKKKVNSLLASLRRERAKEKKKSGMAANEVYRLSWFAYNSLAFLLDKFKVKETRSSEDTAHNEEEDIVNANDNTEAEFFTETNLTTLPEQQNSASTSGSALKRLSSKSPKHTKVRKLDAQFSDAMNVIKSVSQKIGANKSAQQTAKSTDDVFGEYVASKLRGYSEYTKSFIQHKINNILFDADMGLFNRPENISPMTVSIPDTSCSTNTTTYSSTKNSPSLILLSTEEGIQYTFYIDDENAQY